MEIGLFIAKLSSAIDKAIRFAVCPIRCPLEYIGYTHSLKRQWLMRPLDRDISQNDSDLQIGSDDIAQWEQYEFPVLENDENNV